MVAMGPPLPSPAHTYEILGLAEAWSRLQRHKECNKMVHCFIVEKVASGMRHRRDANGYMHAHQPSQQQA